MSWIFKNNYQLKKNKNSSDKQNTNLWHKCIKCHHLMYLEDFKKNHTVCVRCNFHDKLSAQERIDLLIDEGSFQENNQNLLAEDFLDFFDGELSYRNKLKQLRQIKHLNDAVITGKGTLNKIPISIAAMDFSFMGGSMGSVVGEKITRTIELATKEMIPAIVVCSSGGARMQEGILSLMQMAKTSAAIQKHHEKGLLYIALLTNPTTGGVTASFAMLGDFIIAEPGALIGFAGPRVIAQTIQQKLPEDFQRTEFLQEHGFIDMISQRHELKNLLFKVINYASS